MASTAKPLSRICRELSCRQCSCPIVSYPFVAPSHLRMLYPVGRKRCDSLMMLCVGEVLCIVCTPWPRFDSTIAGKHSPPRLMLLYCNQMLFIIPKCPPTQISSHFHTHIPIWNLFESNWAAGHTQTLSLACISQEKLRGGSSFHSIFWPSILDILSGSLVSGSRSQLIVG